MCDSKAFFHGYNDEKIDRIIRELGLNISRPDDLHCVWRCVVADIQLKWIEADRMYDDDDDVSKALNDVEGLINRVKFQQCASSWFKNARHSCV